MSGAGTGTPAVIEGVREDYTTPPTYNEFVILYPAFNTLASLIVENALTASARLLDFTAWGDFYFDAVGLDVAHQLTLASQAATSLLAGFQGAAGPVTSVSAAGVSTGFSGPDVASGSKADSWYSKTVYGQQFLRLRDNVLSLGVMTC